VKNKVARPFLSCSLRMMFGDDGMVKFDFTHSLLEYLIELGKIPYAKPRVTWTDGKQYYVKALAAHIDKEGLQAELKALLTK
jgi:hypothetical protein